MQRQHSRQQQPIADNAVSRAVDGAAMDFFNQEPVVHTWTHQLDSAD
jgi:hypothetical protein